jgi:hypothetical protein
MPHMPSKDAMIHAVRTSGCQNLKSLPLESMTQEAVYGHLLASKCPCLQRLLHGKNPPHSTKI